MNNIIKKGISALRQDAVTPHAQRVRNGIFGNPLVFPTPPMTEAEFQDLIDNWAVSLVGAETRDSNKVAIKNDDRKFLNAGIEQLFNFALTKVGNDITKATQSGFPLSKIPSPVGDMPAPLGLRVKSSATGKCRVTFNKVSGARCYLLQYAPVADVDFISDVATETRNDLTSLKSLSMYKFRVAAIGAKGQGPFCDVLTSAVL